MEWPFSPRQREIAAVADAIGREALEPNAEELDRTGLYPRANLLHTARAGLNGLLLPEVALEILAPDRVFGIRGTARVCGDQVQSCPFPAVLVEIDVLEGRDHTGRGIVWQGPAYSYAEGKEHRYAVEWAVLAEIRAGASLAVSHQPSADG